MAWQAKFAVLHRKHVKRPVGSRKLYFPNRRKPNKLDALVVRRLLVSLDTEETDSTALSVVLLGNVTSGKRGVVSQRSLAVSSLRSVAVVGVTLGLVDSLNVLSVRAGNVGSTSDEENQEQNGNSSPSHGQRLHTNVGLQTLSLEGVSSQNDDGSLESSGTGNEEKINHNQENKHLVNDSEAEAQHGDKQGETRESKGQQEEGKCKSGQVVVGVSVVNKVLWHISNSVKVVDRRKREGWSSETRAEVVVVTNTPECPGGLGVSVSNLRSVTSDPVETVEWEVISRSRQDQEHQQEGGARQKQEVQKCADNLHCRL